MKSSFYRLSALYWRIRTRGRLSGASFRVRKPLRVDLTAPLELGPGAVIDSASTLVVRRPSSIGRGFYAGHGVHIVAFESVAIGNDVLLGERVSLHTENHGGHDERQTFANAPITIEDDVWVGAGAVILPGVTIGARSVIGANAVVNRDVPADSLAVGVPVVVKARSDDGDA